MASAGELTIHLDECGVAAVTGVVKYLENILALLEHDDGARGDFIAALQGSFGTKDRLPLLFQTMTAAANRMGSAALFDLLCKLVADMIAERTPNDILEFFKVKNDATWEEEQELIATHSWIVRVQRSLFVSLWSRQCQM